MQRTLLFLAACTMLALPAMAAESGGGGAVGGKCTATSSSGTKISGVYANDVDGLNCAGAGGSINCKNADGTDSGKCHDAKATATRHPTTDTMAPTTHPATSTY